MSQQTIQKLRKISRRKRRRAELIRQFQQDVRSGRLRVSNELANDVLTRLAVELDRYVLDKHFDERAVQKVRKAIQEYELFTTGRIAVSPYKRLAKWMRELLGDKRCPVCKHRCYCLPWDGESPSYEICESCGIQFGYTDFAGGGSAEQRKKVYGKWYAQWVANDRKPIERLS